MTGSDCSRLINSMLTYMSLSYSMLTYMTGADYSRLNKAG